MAAVDLEWQEVGSVRPWAMAGWLSLSLVPLVAAGHGDAKHAARPAVTALAPEQTPWGIAGEAGASARHVSIEMSDKMRFTPDQLTVRRGETIRFSLANRGQLLHEMVIGTRGALEEHAELMKRYPNMEHAEAYMAHVPAGAQGEIVWTFNRAGDFEFACLLPGHFQAGMVGRIRVVTE